MRTMEEAFQDELIEANKCCESCKNALLNSRVHFEYGFKSASAEWQKIVKPLENQLEVLINFLKITDEKWWFDHKDSKSKSLACACMFCDMGDSGRKKNPDGHDMDCHISNGHYLIEYAKQALANYRKEME